MARSPFNPARKRFRSLAGLLMALGLAALVATGTSCPGLTPGQITVDTTMDTLNIAAGSTLTLLNNAKLTITGDAVIDGTLTAPDSRLTLQVGGSLTVNGKLQSNASSFTELDTSIPFDQQPVGINIIVGNGEARLGANVVIETNGNIVVTDDPTVLSQTPEEFFDQVEDVSGDDLPTLVPLPPDNPAFNDSIAVHKELPIHSGAALPPVVIGGVWPPPGAAAPPGDQPVWIFRFNGNRPLNLDNWTANIPPAPAPAGGNNGLNGLNLLIFNNGGPINIVGGVVLNLADGSDGAGDTKVCATATGKNGGKAGNFRMTAAGGIDMSDGTLTINPGRSGAGGAATVTEGPAAAGGCPGGTGQDSTAIGGNAADNEKRLFVRGAVDGVENIIIGPLIAGDGGNATATACDGGPGSACCDGGPGGAGTATGGKGGNASLNISGLPVTSGAVFGGEGGDATATGGDGGAGGDCKFFDAGDGGDGGAATATGGAGGTASTTGGGFAFGGNGGDATATGGNGGPGGDSGFGTPGAGGAGGAGSATAGAGGAGAPAGVDGAENPADGNPGPAGGQLAVFLYCFNFGLVSDDGNGVVPPGPQEGPVFSSENNAQIGTLQVDFRNLPGAEYFASDNPVGHVGIQNGQLDVNASSLQLTDGQPGLIGGLRLATLYGNGIDEANPLVVQALDAGGQVIGTQSLASVPNNQGDPSNPQTVDVKFDVSESVDTFRIIVPETAFVTIIYCYLLDP